ncbi:MAG: NTP transferase domain-containing protein [Sphingorhabdus sp.]
MSSNSGIMLALLAAGQSRRFGDRDKLSALLGDKMLGLHAAETGATSPFRHKLVIGSPDHPCAAQWSDLGYRVIANEQAAMGQATSVRLAAASAIEAGAAALCIMLADMPFVTSDHIGRLMTAFETTDGTTILASSRNGLAMPPAIFPHRTLETLLALEGDAGARTLLEDAQLIAGDDPLLMDIDSEADLAQAHIMGPGVQ